MNKLFKSLAFFVLTLFMVSNLGAFKYNAQKADGEIGVADVNVAGYTLGANVLAMGGATYRGSIFSVGSKGRYIALSESGKGKFTVPSSPILSEKNLQGLTLVRILDYKHGNSSLKLSKNSTVFYIDDKIDEPDNSYQPNKQVNFDSTSPCFNAIVLPVGLAAGLCSERATDLNSQAS